jgi:hypothetical protein
MKTKIKYVCRYCGEELKVGEVCIDLIAARTCDSCDEKIFCGEIERPLSVGEVYGYCESDGYYR